MPLPRVPRERVVDAAPVALVLILLSAIDGVPIYAPASMLHIWLWLRHPRSKSRYLIFACVAAIPFGLFVVFPLTDYGGRMGTSHIPSILITFTSAGILPILYRLLSRCTLTDNQNPINNDQSKKSRAGISDLLALSLLCAVTLAIVRLPRDQIGWDYAPSWDLVATLVFSAVGLVAMRLQARSNYTFAFALSLIHI